MYLLAWLNKDFGSFKSIGMRFHHVVLNQDSFKKEKKKEESHLWTDKVQYGDNGMKKEEGNLEKI